MVERCPDCGVPYALVGRVHRCIPRPALDKVAESAAMEAERQAILSDTDHDADVVRKPKPKRDRAKYMREYRRTRTTSRPT